MKKCTLCIDRIYNAPSGRGGPHSGVRAGVPHGRAPLRGPCRSRTGGLASGGERGGFDLMPELGYSADQRVPAATAAPDRTRLHRRSVPLSNRQSRRGSFLAWLDRVLRTDAVQPSIHAGT